MKKTTSAAAALILGASTLFSAGSAMADVSYNIGYVSEYHFRGILQKNSSASGGIDFEESGFYIGTWAADVGDGLEVDLYGGYGIETDAGLSASIGFTGYYYTGEFDDTYQEINLNFGYQMVSLEYSFGNYDNFGGPELDYDFLALTIDPGNGFYGKYGTFGDDFDGDYFEFGYGTTVSDIDLGVSFIFADEMLGDQLDANGAADNAQSLVFSIGKSF